VKLLRILTTGAIGRAKSGMKPEQIMEEYDLAEEDILACIAYGAATVA
jgi:uncharacterized protein (DUF433 family)